MRRPPASNPTRPAADRGRPATASASGESARTTSPLPMARATSDSVRARTRAAGGLAVVAGAPRQRAHREPVPVGRQQGDLVALDLDPHPREDGQRLVAAGRHDDLGDRGGEDVARDAADHGGHRRQGRVLLDGHREEREAARAARDHHAGPLQGHLHRLRRQGAGDVGQQPARDQHAARLVHLGRRPRRARRPRSRSWRASAPPARRPPGGPPTAPAREGAPGRVRAVHPTASARTSRSTPNFTGAPSRESSSAQDGGRDGEGTDPRPGRRSSPTGARSGRAG